MNKLRLLIIFAIVILAFFLFRGKISHEKFDANLWKNANFYAEENWSLRWDMMNDLRNENKLIGMTKIQIINLLGEPGYETISEFNYDLGYTGKGINTGTLIITFNEDDIVTKTIVWQG